MNTTILLKTDKTLKDEASRVARAMGIPLTTVMNAYLRQFVRDRSISLSMEPQLSPRKLKELIAISDDMDKGKNIGFATNDPEKLFKHLGI